jgi:selenide,water dikinase
LKRGKAQADHIEHAVRTMVKLNRRAAEIAIQFNADAMTDVTGFGLAGHALEVAKASRISIHIDHRRLPILPGSLEYSRAGYCAGGLNSNREFYGADVYIKDGVSSDTQNLLFDPQTSGGLLIFCPNSTAGSMLSALQAAEIEAVEIGFTDELSEHLLTVS